MLRFIPVGLAAAPVANQATLGLNFRESLCKPYCITSSIQPFASVTYSAGPATIDGTTVFVPITARVQITVPGDCPCDSEPQLFTEQFYVMFPGQTALPTNVEINDALGQTQNGADVECGCAHTYSINQPITVTITPGTAPAT